MGKNPKVNALLTGVAAAWLIYSIATATESPSTALAVLQYVIIIGCVIGFIGSVKQIIDEKN